MESENGKLRHYSFYKISFFKNLWDVVDGVMEEAKKKSEIEKIKWAVTDIARIK